MSAALARLRKRAAELEQKKQFDRALEVYVQILDEGGKDLGDEDVPLFNRVGDMLMRKGSVTEALGYYERAVDMYAERGYLNNAIALCSKILRQSPGRAAVYYKLARISAKKGFKSDARKNFLEYADRMQKLGMADEAFRALKEFASLYPDQDDVRLVLAELLSKENRKGEAIEQLQSLYEKLQSEGRAAEARATVDRMRAIDPSVTPRAGTETQPAPPSDLVFLDLSDAEGAPRTPPSGSSPSQPASARAPMPTSVPALTGLSITFFPTEEPTRPEGFETSSVQPEEVEQSPAHVIPEELEFVERSGDSLADDVDETEVAPAPAFEMVEEPPSSPDPFELVDLNEPAAAPVPDEQSDVETIAESLPVESTADFAIPDADEPADPAANAAPLSGAQFADIELEETPYAAPAREHDLALPGTLPVTPEELEVVAGPSPASAAAADDARAAAEEAADLVADIAAREAAQHVVAAIPSTPATLVDETETAAPDESADQALDLIGAEPAEPPNEFLPDDFLSSPPSFGGSSTTDDHAFPPLDGLAESAAALEEFESLQEAAMGEQEIERALEPVVPQQYVPTPVRGTISIGTAEGHLRRRLELDPENYHLRRQLGEALLDTGDRDGGLHELELAMVGFELRGEMERAQEVVDEILHVQPASVAHHQKRVEYAVRSRDRGRLTNSYLELADALFRTGAGDKAIAVYGRVLELDPANERAEFALSTLAPDELVRLRGRQVRPERWSDELHAIDGEASTRQADLPERTAEAPEVMVAASQAPVPHLPTADTPIDVIELPDPDWGEGVPARVAQGAVEEPAGKADTAPAESDSAWETLVTEGEVEVHEAADVTPQEQQAVHALSESVAEESVEEGAPLRAPTPRQATPIAPPRVPTPRAATPIETTRVPTPRAATPVAPSRVPTPRAETPVAPPRVPTPRMSTPAAPPRMPTPRMSTPAAPPRMPTPRAPTPLSAARVTPRPEIPVSNDADFVDLGEWLRDTEPARSTRMQVESPKPTGDEQADFEELLRRFKRGVAENVEAEDYDAHYDLGVAYKEMGLVDEAIAQFQKALRGPEHRVRSYEALGQCFVEKQQYPIAAALLQRATEVPGSDDQQLVGVLYLLGFATEHMGRPAEALAYYLRVFAVDIEFRDVAARVAAMGNLTK
jgi:tetratricopeptide (TPR) repeat protein